MNTQPTLQIFERRRYREAFAMLGAISTGLAVIALALALLSACVGPPPWLMS